MFRDVYFFIVFDCSIVNKKSSSCSCCLKRNAGTGFRVFQTFQKNVFQEDLRTKFPNHFFWRKSWNNNGCVNVALGKYSMLFCSIVETIHHRWVVLSYPPKFHFITVTSIFKKHIEIETKHLFIMSLIYLNWIRALFTTVYARSWLNTSYFI